MGGSVSVPHVPWDTLAAPLDDIFLQEIVPNYLTIGDLVRLSAVSQRYHQLFSPQGERGKKILAFMLEREATHGEHGGSKYSYVEQLPTFGNYSVEESLREDPMLVAQLREAALRRRGLILLRAPSTAAEDDGLQAIVSKFSAKGSNSDILAAVQKADKAGWGLARGRPAVRTHGARRSLPTQFLCANQSGADIYCHFIDQAGDILVRDGDRIPSRVAAAAGGVDQRETSFHVEEWNVELTPPHIFRHFSQAHHSFALCHRAGGSPFAIYQQRRVFGTTKAVSRDGILQLNVHAIAIKSGGEVEELHCNFSNRLMRASGSYIFYNRATGEEEEQRVLGRGSAQSAKSGSRHLATTFYGASVPRVDSPAWESARAMAKSLGDVNDPLNYFSFIGEVLTAQL